MSLSCIASRFSRLLRALVVAAAAGLALVAAAPAVASVPGSLDPTFNPGPGYVDPGYSSTGLGVMVAMLPDGKWVFGGDSLNCMGWLGADTCTGAGETVRSYIAGTSADGAVDPSFNPNANGGVLPIAIQPDGKVLIGGTFTTIGGVARNRIARLNANGSLDTGFNPNASSTVQMLIVQPDGKILVGGNFTTIGGVTRNRIARLNADGTLDTGFNPNADNRIFTAAVQRDGKIVIGGTFTTIGGVTRNRIARLNADGTLDTGFDPNADESVRALVVQPDGKILIGGSFTAVGGFTRHTIARLNADGTLDASFNPSIGLNLDDDGSNCCEKVLGITLQADGKVLAGGEFNCVGWDGDNDCTDPGETRRNRIARLNADGSVDASFNPSLGLLTYSHYWDDADVGSMVFQPDGKLVISGTFDCVGWNGDANCTNPGETVRYSAARLLAAAPTAAPTAPTAVAGDARATVSWTAVPGDIASYTVTSSPGGKTCTATAPATSCVVEGLTNGTTYTFTVKANNAFGEGPTSVASNAVTPAANAQAAAEANPKITIPAAVVTRGRTLTSTVNPSVGGTVRVTATLAGRTACTVTRKATKAGRMKVTCTLNARTRAIIKKKAVTLKVTARLTDAAGKTATASRNVRVARYVVRTPVTG